MELQFYTHGFSSHDFFMKIELFDPCFVLLLLAALNYTILLPDSATKFGNLQPFGLILSSWQPNF